ncbi:MAG: DUF6198 family protein [Clostridiaceae bacterium]
MKKKNFYTEIAYVMGIILLALGTAFMEKANFGVSMVVAPAYIFYLKLSEAFSFITFGMMEYILQGSLLVIMMLVLRKFRISYLFSFITALLYGFTLDFFMSLVVALPDNLLPLRILLYVAGLLTSACGVAFMFHTYISPAVYELLVKELSSEYKININKFKTAYDCTSCLLSILLSFLFFGFLTFKGINVGTVIAALLNGWLIGTYGRFMDKRWFFIDKLNLRRYFS